MHFKTKKFLLTFFAFHSFAACAQHSDNTVISLNALQHLTALESFEIIESDKEGKIIILDIRTSGEYARERIPGAINLDYLSPEFRNNLKNLDNEKTYLIYCRTGGRSSQALKVMGEEGFKNIYHMKRGIADWLRERLPLEQ